MKFDTHKFYVLESRNMQFMCYGVVCLRDVLYMYDVRAGFNLVIRMYVSERTRGHIVFKTPEHQPCRIRNAKLQDAGWFCGEGMEYPGNAKQFFRWLRCLAGLGSCRSVVRPVAEHQPTNADCSHKTREEE